jgi:LacI family transcriptional regulator
MPSTIDHVAKRAGVSKATVSRVINNSKTVSSELRMKVLVAVEELNFVPNPAARSLVSKKSRIIGVVVTDVTNLFVSVLVKSIENYALNQGYNIMIINSNGITVREIDLLLMLKDKRVDGIIFLTSHLMQEHKLFFKASSLPIALINVSGGDESIIGIRIDNRRAAFEMTCYFLKKGYTRVGMIRAPRDDLFTGKERFSGYRQALKESGIAYNEQLVTTGSLRVEDGYRAARALLENGTEPEALFAACDLMAFGAIRAILDSGRKVPEDIEVAGFDDVPMASYYNPTLTTVHQPIEEMGKLAAEKLIEIIEGKTVDQCDIVLPFEIVFRESTAKTDKY